MRIESFPTFPLRANDADSENTEQSQPEVYIDEPQEANSLGRILAKVRRMNEKTAELEYYSATYELSISEDLSRDLDLYVSVGNEKKPLIKVLADYDESAGEHNARMIVPDQGLLDNLKQNSDFDTLLDGYLQKFQTNVSQFLQRVNNDNNGHKVTIQNISKEDNETFSLEFIHQQRHGDCVLANYLNTSSLERNGHLPMTIREARDLAISLRQDSSENIEDIVLPDSPLNYRDVCRLFSRIHDMPPQQQDILTINGINTSLQNLQNQASLILNYLNTYPSGLLTTGMGYHSRTIKRLDNERYLMLDPLDPVGAEEFDTEEITLLLARLMLGKEKDQNFFFFVRDRENESPGSE